MASVVIVTLITTFTYYSVSSLSWIPEKVPNPLQNIYACNIFVHDKSLICDPENRLSSHLKYQLHFQIMREIPEITPCYCGTDCEILPYRKHLRIGLLVLSDINRTASRCGKYNNPYDCFSERVLERWNATDCNGNNGMILMTNTKINVYFGAVIRHELNSHCQKILIESIRRDIPLLNNVRLIVKKTTLFLRKPCLCTQTCNFRHLKWLTNVVFFLGVVILVTCIAGMSRRVLIAKITYRPFERNTFVSRVRNIRQPEVVRPPEVVNYTVENPSGEQRPPNYSSLTPLPQPPPYSVSVNSQVVKDTLPNSQAVNQNFEMEPPAYEAAVRNPETSRQT